MLRERTKQLVLSEYKQYKASRESLAAQIESRRASIRATDIEVEKLTASIPLTQELLDAQDALLKDGLTQKTNVIRLQQTLLEANAEKAKLSETLLSTRSSVTDLEAQLSALDAQFQSNAIGLAREARKTIRLLKQNIKKEETRIAYRNLTAPVAGTIHQLSVNTIGAVVTSADPLLAIIPDNTPLEVEAFVLNKDRGFLQEGQETEVKLEACSFTRYGTITGTIAKIADDVIVHEVYGPAYKVSAELNAQEITADGLRVALKPGMTATIKAKTGLRKIID